MALAFMEGLEDSADGAGVVSSGEGEVVAGVKRRRTNHLPILISASNLPWLQKLFYLVPLNKRAMRKKRDRLTLLHRAAIRHARPPLQILVALKLLYFFQVLRGQIRDSSS